MAACEYIFERLPSGVQEFCNNFYRYLKLVGLEHMVQFNSRVRVGLFLSCVISCGFSGLWLADLVQLTCFESVPWTEEGVARHTCFFQAIGSIVFLVMFRDSLTALAFYDDDTEQLTRSKTQLLDEVKIQVKEMLIRATKSAGELAALLSRQFGEHIDSHVSSMKLIIQNLERHYPSPSGNLRQRLLKGMARHLHELRQPALQPFEKLIQQISSDELKQALQRARCQSMVELLVGNQENNPHAGTLDVKRACSVPGAEGSYTSLILDRDTELALQKEVQDMEKAGSTSPQLVVLQPVNIILQWTSRLEADGIFFISEGVGSKYFSFVRGTMFCALYLGFYLYMCLKLLGMIIAHECTGLQSFECLGALVRKLSGLCCMASHLWCMRIVISNVGQVDEVWQLHEEIRQWEDYKKDVEKCNALALNVRIMDEISQRLHDKRHVVDVFMKEGFGVKVSEHKYEELARCFEGAEIIPQTDPQMPRLLSRERRSLINSP